MRWYDGSAQDPYRAGVSIGEVFLARNSPTIRGTKLTPTVTAAELSVADEKNHYQLESGWLPDFKIV